MNFVESIQQLRDKQLADQKDAERFLSVKALFEQLKQLYPDQNYDTLCHMVLKKYRSTQDKPAFYWFSNGRWISPYPRFIELNKKYPYSFSELDGFSDADTALRAVSDSVMKTDKLAGYGFLRSEITTVLGIAFDTTPLHIPSDSQAYAELQAENSALKEQIEYLKRRLSAPMEKAEDYALIREEVLIAAIASLYDKKRTTAAKGSLPIPTELLKLVESRISLFWTEEQCLPRSAEVCQNILREAIDWLDKPVTDMYLRREAKRQEQRDRKNRKNKK